MKALVFVLRVLGHAWCAAAFLILLFYFAILSLYSLEGMAEFFWHLPLALAMTAPGVSMLLLAHYLSKRRPLGDSQPPPPNPSAPPA